MRVLQVLFCLVLGVTAFVASPMLVAADPCYDAFGDVVDCAADAGVDDPADAGLPEADSPDRVIAGGGGGVGDPVALFDPTGGKTIENIFQAILDIIMVFAIPIIVFFMIWAGFLYVTATGNPDKISKANNALMYAIIGGVIVLGANVLLEVITTTIELFKD